VPRDAVGLIIWKGFPFVTALDPGLQTVSNLRPVRLAMHQFLAQLVESGASVNVPGAEVCVQEIQTNRFFRVTLNLRRIEARRARRPALRLKLPWQSRALRSGLERRPPARRNHTSDRPAAAQCRGRISLRYPSRNRALLNGHRPTAGHSRAFSGLFSI
jgi:hypothetical protein